MFVVDVPVSCHDKLALLLLQSVQEAVCDSCMYHASLRMLLLLQSVVSAGLGLLCTCKVTQGASSGLLVQFAKSAALAEYDTKQSMFWVKGTCSVNPSGMLLLPNVLQALNSLGQWCTCRVYDLEMLLFFSCLKQ